MRGTAFAEDANHTHVSARPLHFTCRHRAGRAPNFTPWVPEHLQLNQLCTVCKSPSCSVTSTATIISRWCDGCSIFLFPPSSSPSSCGWFTTSQVLLSSAPLPPAEGTSTSSADTLPPPASSSAGIPRLLCGDGDGRGAACTFVAEFGFLVDSIISTVTDLAISRAQSDLSVSVKAHTYRVSRRRAAQKSRQQRKR